MKTLDPRDATILSVVLKMEPDTGRWDDLVAELSSGGREFLDRVLMARASRVLDERSYEGSDG